MAYSSVGLKFHHYALLYIDVFMHFGCHLSIPYLRLYIQYLLDLTACHRSRVP